ncbi:DUF4397 domain-containing protein [Cyclobacterium plantarum]|uniref:DUF4397 domain-containing protein n=1 Tax=Cyclobacterium plantarum TaxID=2716263 RepID=A0ABX0H905_9BACT|nr:DUF4397 domain-containing protein [Cyclobacterium plantarum]NHE57850.1 DUF4397 domain-containing protein [Cyclobacterium plantarum]
MSAIGVGMIAVVISACDVGDDDPVPLPDISYVGLYNASPDSPPLDILMENGRINYYPLRYSDYSNYLNFYAGERTMRVSPVNASNVVVDTTFNFEPEAAYSLFYVNEYDDIQAFLVEDEVLSLSSGEAAVRFIHLSPDSPEVNLVRSVEDETTVLADGNAYLDPTSFMAVESGVQSFQVNLTDNGEEVLSIPDLNLRSGGVYTILARGYNNPPAGNNNNLSADVLINN